MSTVILIRGNSGSGKTTVANDLHHNLSTGNLLISQDYVRRTMLKVKDRPDNLAIGLIQSMIEYGINYCEYTIIEGILGKSLYGDMLTNTLKKADNVLAYYYDLSFEETIKRHRTKKEIDFDESKLKDWFIPHDLIGLPKEILLTEDISKEDTLKLILTDLNFL